MTMSDLSSVTATEGGRCSCSQGDQPRCPFPGGGGLKDRRRWHQGPNCASCCTSSAARPQGCCSASGGGSGPGHASLEVKTSMPVDRPGYHNNLRTKVS